jgi:hypothetical protein
MAVQVDVRNQEASFGRLLSPSRPPSLLTTPSDRRRGAIPTKLQLLRRRRLVRRIRGAASTACWLAGSGVLLLMVLGGLANLR